MGQDSRQPSKIKFELYFECNTYPIASHVVYSKHGYCYMDITYPKARYFQTYKCLRTHILFMRGKFRFIVTL